MRAFIIGAISYALSMGLMYLLSPHPDTTSLIIGLLIGGASMTIVLSKNC
jgi:hypothetical protein